jgi:hypothetical protein
MKENQNIAGGILLGATILVAIIVLSQLLTLIDYVIGN